MQRQGRAAILPQSTITALAAESVHTLDVSLATNTQD